MNTSTVKIATDSLDLYYGTNHALKNVSMELYTNKITAFIGPSGCGKSTTLRMIAGLEDISDGELWIDGELCNYYEPKDRGLSMVFQNYALYPNMTVYGNLAYALKIRKVPKKEIDKKVHQVAKVLEIEQLLDRKPSALSGGQKQRVAIGSAIIRKPKAFLMDEPLSNLDAKLRAQMRIELAKLHRELGTTMIYVTHDQTEAMTLGTRIVVMKDGVVQQVESPANIYNNPRNQFVAGFIGSPSMNFFDAYVGEEEGKTTLYLGGTELGKKVYVDGSRGQILKEQENGKKVVIGIRPEDIWEYEDAVHRGFDEASVDIVETITAREMPGAEVILYFDAQNKSHAVRLRPDNQTRTGEKLQLYFDPEKLHVFDKETGENLFYREEISL